jgi:hypothetical protein
VRRSLFALYVVSACATAGEQLLDPTQPPRTHTAAIARQTITEPQHFSVTAIRIAPGGRSAIVNDRLVRVGDRVGDAAVVEIKSGAVILDYLSEQVQIDLVSAAVARRAPRVMSTEKQL